MSWWCLRRKNKSNVRMSSKCPKKGFWNALLLKILKFYWRRKGPRMIYCKSLLFRMVLCTIIHMHWTSSSSMIWYIWRLSFVDAMQKDFFIGHIFTYDSTRQEKAKAMDNLMLYWPTIASLKICSDYKWVLR